MKKYPEQFDVIVVGGGASGMMAAGRAAERGKRVLLVEKNKDLGAKLKITGGGRCNITNAQENRRLFLKNFGKAAPFLHSAFSQFGVQDTFLFFESRGLPLVVQPGNRAFPKTERALDVFNVMEKHVRQGKVTIRTSTPVSRILIEGNHISGVIAGGLTYRAHAVILATGGASHAETGSTADGFKWLAQLGHTVASPTPTIVPLAVADEWVKKLSGVSLTSATITFFVNGVKQFSSTGGILFTHFGISGPTILNSASRVGDLLHSGPVTATIDAFPEEEIDALEKRIITTFDANKNKTLKNLFKEIAPDGTSAAILSIVKDVDANKKVHSVTKDERKIIVHMLKALPLTIAGLLGFDRAVVADGGVELGEINMKTMRSKLYDNLFVTGDLLHIRRPSGGYSLQLCWTTGYVAGSNV